MVSVEDRRFFHHWGIDPYRMMGALRANWRHRRIVEGASTITQQAVRSALHITRRGLVRKIVEIPIAVVLERFLAKEAILELYFNSIYWGRGATTVAAAAVDFFGQNLWQLNLKQLLALASLPNHPLRWEITPADLDRLERKIAICLTILEQQKVIDSTIVALARQQSYQLVQV
jgi:penicillin-binding protein 1A